MTERPLVSIVTPSYNQGKFLEECILSVLNQDYPRLEYLIIDGASGDESQEVLKRYEDQLAYVESYPDRGQAHAINKGLIRSKGEILGWLNADDILLPGTVSRVVSEFQQRSPLDVVYGRLERIDETGQVVPTPLLPKDMLTFDRSLVIGECIVNQPGSFWRRRVMDAVGLLDESLVYSMDYEYWIRLALVGAKFQRLPDVLARFRLSKASKTVTQPDKMAEEQLQVLERTLSIPELAVKLGLSEKEICEQSRKARARIGLHAFYGTFKRRDLKNALQWLKVSLQQDPWVIVEARWRKLALAGISRRYFRLK